MRSLGRFLGIRPGEARLAATLAALFAVLEAGRGLGEIAAGTLFLSRVGAAYLPYLFVALGLLSMVFALGYGTGLGMFRRRSFLVSVIAGFAALLLAERLVLAVVGQPILPVLWLTTNIAGGLLTTIAWTVAGSTVDARQAKRLFPICTSAAIAGGFAGTLASGPLARVVGVETLVVLFAALLLVAGALAARALGRAAAPLAPVVRSRAAVVTQVRAGFDDVRRSSLMRLVALAYVLFALLLYPIQFVFETSLSAAYKEADLAATLGLLSAAVTAASFLLSITVANRFYARFGITAATLALPIVYMAGFGLWIAQFSLATAVTVRFMQQVTQRGLSNAAWSAMFNVIPVERRAQVLAFVDGIPSQLGTTISGLLLLVAGALLTPTQTFAMGVLIALTATWVVLQIRRRYGNALLQALRSGRGEQVLEGGPGLAAVGGEPQLREALQAAVAAEGAGVRRLAAELLGRVGDAGSQDVLLQAADDAEAEVRRAALDALAAIAPDGRSMERAIARLEDPDPSVRAAAVRVITARDGSSLAGNAALLADPSPLVRAELAVALATSGNAAGCRSILEALAADEDAGARVAALVAAARVGDPLPASFIARSLSDPSPMVRASAVTALGSRAGPAAAAGDGAGDGPDDAGTLTEPLIAALDDGALPVRRAASAVLAQRTWEPRSTAAVLRVLATGSERAQVAALGALAGNLTRARAPVRAWALGQVDRALELRRWSAALAGREAAGQGVPTPPAGAQDDGTSAFLRFLVERRVHRIEERLLGAVAALGAPEADGPIRRSLRSPSPDTRAQAVEALEALGDRELGRAIVGLLEAEPEVRSTDPASALETLGEDPDPWIRMLALRARAARLARDWRMINERTAADPDPVVRAGTTRVADPGEPAMPATTRTLGEIERMLFLRRVPLFAQLDPEDLQRVAAAAVERTYAAGEALVREGEAGDELIVIVDGSVQVMRATDDGAERLIRAYGPGDHIGELAVLRDRPRAATVIADEDGVRGLVIAGEPLRAILHERPEAAMAMLATLADRISAQ